MVTIPGRHSPVEDIEARTATTLDFSKAALPAAPQVGEASLRAAQALPAYLGGTGYDPLGLPRLRQALAERYTAKGVPTEPENIMVTLGAQHAISLITKTFLSRADTALVEAPSYPHAYDALRLRARKLATVTVDPRRGWDDHGLAQTFREARPALAYVMPDFHNPTGAVMPAPQRQLLMDLARRHDSLVVADETTADLRIDGAAGAPLANYGPALLVGSMGKTVWGGLRIGWIRAERDKIRRLEQSRYAQDLGTPILEQLIALDLLGQYEEILRYRTVQLREGRDHAEELLRSHFPQWDVPHVAGGLCTWVNIGEPVSSQLALAAREGGLPIGAGPRFGLGGAFERFLRFPLSYPAEETSLAVEILAEAWHRVEPLRRVDGDFTPALV